MATKLNTRILLRYDSYENWIKDTATQLLEGEVGICTVPAGYTKSDSGATVQNPPKTLMKIGPGAFKDLPWLSATAADVFAWAKLSGDDFKLWMEGTKTIEGLNRPALATAAEVSTISSNLSALTTRVGTAEDNITTINGQIEALDGRIDTAETNITTIGGRLDTLEELTGTGDNGLGKRVTALESDNTTNKSNISSNTTAIENITKEGGAIDTAVAAEAEIARAAEKANADAIEAIEADYLKAADKQELNKAITDEASARESAVSGLNTSLTAEINKKANAADVYTKTEADAEFMTQTEVRNYIDEVVGDLTEDETTTGIVSLVEYVRDNASDLAGLTNTVAGHTDSLSTQAGQITALQNKDTALDGDIKAINDKIGSATLDTTATTLIEAINEINTAVGAGDEATLQSAKDYADGLVADLVGSGTVNELSSKVTALEELTAGHTTSINSINDKIGTVAEGKTLVGLIEEETARADAAEKANATAITEEIARAKAAEEANASAIAAEKTARENFDKTSLTGVITEDVLAISLNGAELDLIFQCGGAELA